MGRREAGLFFLAGSLLFGQGTPTKPSAADYPVHAGVAGLSLGAEYLVRSVSLRSRTFFVPDYLVVEVAVFPSDGQKAAMSPQQFHLRINSGKGVLSAQPAAFVAASLRYPDWERRRTLEAVGAVGDRGVILGRPPATERFPGDPRPSQTRLPAPPRAPAAEHEGVANQEVIRADEAVVEAELPSREVSSPVSGYLYFPFKGKTKSIRSLELLYQGPAGTLTLRLQ